MNRKFFVQTVSLGLACLAALPAMAQLTPVGVWHTIDDRTNEPKGEVIITEVNGMIVGRVGRALKPDPKAKRVCDDCKDDRKDQAIVGMEIIRGVKKEGAQAVWAGGGKILDPNEGKEYTVRLTPIEGGQKMQVRGYIGPFYRTQIWLRADSETTDTKKD
ncbi:MAG: DUF2147 domain-containing protein [Betaproteobacteria bacterium]|nr:DUF2147 domain-containing protein [Betaproteobacteria bacterium]NBY06242.1 DUF2147 domain-containing protein [Betaproteobacteria bacterium]